MKPHNAVAKSTVASLVKQILIMPGINTEIFKPHSTRSASLLHARFSDLLLSDILKRGPRSTKVILEKFYRKSVMTSEEKFQKTVLN